MVRGRREACHEDWHVDGRDLASRSLLAPHEAAEHKSVETWDERKRHYMENLESSLCELPQMTAY